MVKSGAYLIAFLARRRLEWYKNLTSRPKDIWRVQNPDSTYNVHGLIIVQEGLTRIQKED